MIARIWADTDLIHVLIGGTRIKTVRSHLSVNDLAKLVAAGASNAGPSPLPPIEDGDAVEVERYLSRLLHISLAGHQLLAAEILGGRLIGDSVQVSGGGLSTRLPTKCRCGSRPVCNPSGTAGEAWLERVLPSS